MSCSTRYSGPPTGCKLKLTHKEEGGREAALFLCRLETTESTALAPQVPEPEPRAASQELVPEPRSCASHGDERWCMHMMMHMMPTAFGLHGDCLGAISRGLGISRGLLGAVAAACAGAADCCAELAAASAL